MIEGQKLIWEPPGRRTKETINPDNSGDPKTKKRNLSSVEGAVPGCGRCSEDAKQEESEGLKLHPHCLYSETLMD